MEIVRVVPNRVWHALDDDQVVGRAYVRRRPDERAFVAVDAWLPETSAALLEVVLADVPGELYSVADEQDADGRALFERAGFAVHREEDEFVIPVGPALAATAGPVPDGVTIEPVQEKESDRLARLDERLRQDVPGSDGWVNEPEEFRTYTFGEHFDPELYLVAAVRDEYAGLVRLWRSARAPRLGLIGVLRWHRRRGLATALLHAAFTPLAGRGIEEVTAEADRANTASQALLAKLGARRTGATVELHRPGAA